MVSMIMAALLAAQGAVVGGPKLSGIVFDEQRRVIPGATVSVQCGSDQRDVVANQDGTFEASVLDILEHSCTGRLIAQDPRALHDPELGRRGQHDGGSRVREPRRERVRDVVVARDGPDTTGVSRQQWTP